MVKINKLHLVLGLVITVIVFIALFFIWDKVPREVPATGIPKIGDIEIIKDEGIPDIKIIGAYWGDSDAPANVTEVCSNQTRDLKEGFLFTIEADTRIIAPNYDECYIINNGEKIDTIINEMHGTYLDLQAYADTDRENRVGICCLLGDRLDCSNTTTLMKCALE